MSNRSHTNRSVYRSPFLLTEKESWLPRGQGRAQVICSQFHLGRGRKRGSVLPLEILFNHGRRVPFFLSHQMHQLLLTIKNDQIYLFTSLPAPGALSYKVGPWKQRGHTKSPGHAASEWRSSGDSRLIYHLSALWVPMWLPHIWEEVRWQITLLSDLHALILWTLLRNRLSCAWPRA